MTSGRRGADTFGVMRLGLFGINLNACATDPAGAIRVAEAAEAAGWESVWTGEHYVLPEPSVPVSPARGDTPMLDPFVALAGVATRTTSLLLGTGVTVVPLHQPLALAKRVASIDQLSGGRFLFGVGVGYLQPEFDALGAAFDHRGARTTEYLDAMEAIWTTDAPRFEGRFVEFAGVRAEPRPVGTPGPPLHFGGYVASTYERANTRGHGWYGYALDLAATEHAIGELRRVSSQTERPPSLPPLEITITPHPSVSLDAAAVETFAGLGVTRLVVLPDRDGRHDTGALVRFVEQVPAALGL